MLMLINVLLLLLGTFMDMAPMILICTPIMLPVVKAMGVDPVHFGMIMLLNLGIGLITPPVGPTLFVGCAIGKVTMEEVSRELWPFYGAMCTRAPHRHLLPRPFALAAAGAGLLSMAGAGSLANCADPFRVAASTLGGGDTRWHALPAVNSCRPRVRALPEFLRRIRRRSFAQQSTVHWIKWNDFVPASDELLRKQMLPEAMKALGIKINLETVNGNDLQPRVTSAIQSGTGPDVFMLFNNHPHIYGSQRRGHRRRRRGDRQGAGRLLQRSPRRTRSDGKKVLSVPWAVIGAMISYRKSWFEEVGLQQLPEDLGRSTTTPARS